MRIIVFTRLIVMFALTICLPGFTQIVKSGPMLGYSTLTETAIWLQTDTEFTSTILYWETNHKSDLINSMTQNESGNTAHVYEFHLSGLKPGTDYSYKLNETVIKGDEPYSFRTKLLWQY
jgi:alkaline phosphatase D